MPLRLKIRRFGPVLLLLLASLSYSQTPLDPAAGAPEEDAAGRARFEQRRLRDPATGRIPGDIRERELEFARSLPTKEALVRQPWYRGERVSTLSTATWSARGPQNVGGRTRAIAVDVTNPDIILAGGVTGGLWRTTDGGGTWTKVSEVSALQSVTCIVQDTRPGHTNVWYHGTGEILGNSASAGTGGPGFHFTGDGVFKSTDNGVSWTVLPATQSHTPQTMDQFDFVYSLAIDPSTHAADVVYAACYGGIFRSSDGGASWSRTLGDSSGAISFASSLFTDVRVSPSGTVYAAMSQGNMYSFGFGADSSSASRGIYRSTDGLTWTSILPAGWPLRYNRVVLDIAPSNENIVYFLGDTPGSGIHVPHAGGENYTSLWKYTYHSGNGSGAGGNWVDRSANLPVGGIGGTFAHQVGYDLDIKVKPDTADVVFIAGVNLYRSADGFASTGGTTWIGGWAVGFFRGYDNHHADVHGLAFSPGSPSVLLTASDGGVHRTPDALATTVVWQSLNSGYLTTQFYSAAIDHASPGNSIILGGAQDNGTLFGNTAAPGPWREVDVFDGGYCAIADGRTSYYMSRQYGATYRRVLDDSGVESAWARVDPLGATDYIFITPLALDPNVATRMYLVEGASLWRNDSLTSIPLSSFKRATVGWVHLTNSAVASGLITAMGVSTVPANRVYYGTSEGAVYRLDGANAGNPVPTNITGASFPAGGYVNCIAVDPTDANRLLVVFSNYGVRSLFYSTDGGASWTDVSANLEQHPDGTGNGPSCRWATIVPSRGFLVATSTGIYSTVALNGGATIWAQEGATSLGNVVVDMMEVRLSDGFLVAATHGNGIYSTNVNTLVGADARIPSEFALEQSFPNPGRPRTVIRYSLPHDVHVSLRVYDVLGRAVATLVDERQPAGYRSVEWDVSKLSAGLYFYRLQAGGFTDTRKLMLAR